ncbi:hypothetical protein Zmor_000179 [Zophobas morio]|uniref:Uncharacterized protein n=1 Tax=Zophobas morio TaxID=2755281 RepID=A0AA38MQ90_9CUCU|nr:hypothetical protein Zmor_000179 [Zophobas morio]
MINTNRCNTCGQCYDIFENNIKIKKGDIETILRNLIEKYRKQLTELQKALETLLKNIEQLETELKLLNIMNNQVKRRMNNLQEQIKQLQKDIKKVEEALKKIGEDVVAELKTIKDKIKNIQDRLKKLNFDTDNIALLNIDKFNNITNNLDDMERRFPKIDNTSLNLALSIESDIDLLESIIKSFEGNGTTFPQNAKASTNWIEPDLLWLINVVNWINTVSG